MLRLFYRELCRLDRVSLSAFKHGKFRLGADDLELLDRCRSINIASDKQRFLVILLFQVQAELAAHCRLSRALKTRHQDDRGLLRAKLKLCARLPHEPCQLFIDDLDDLLPRREALEHFLSDRALRHGLDKVFDHEEVDVGLEQRKLDLAHNVAHILLGELAAPGQFLENTLQFSGDAFKRHRRPPKAVRVPQAHGRAHPAPASAWSFRSPFA